MAETLADDPGVEHARARPDRGPHRTDSDEDYLSLMRSQPGRPAGGERMLTRARPRTCRCELTEGAVAIAGRPILRRIDLTVRAGRVRRADGRQRLRQVDAGPRADRPPAAGDRVPSSCSAPRSRTSTTGSGSASCRSAAAPASGVPASVWEVVASGRLTRRRLLRPARRAPTGPRSTTRSSVVGLDRPRPRRASRRSPAASSSGR